MVNSLLTILFDLVLISTAGSVVIAMVMEYLTNRDPAVGTVRGTAKVARTGMYARQRSASPTRRQSPARPARSWQV